MVAPNARPAHLPLANEMSCATHEVVLLVASYDTDRRTVRVLILRGTGHGMLALFEARSCMVTPNGVWYLAFTTASVQDVKIWLSPKQPVSLVSHWVGGRAAGRLAAEFWQEEQLLLVRPPEPPAVGRPRRRRHRRRPTIPLRNRRGAGYGADPTQPRSSYAAITAG